jgi:hypothetical protein
MLLTVRKTKKLGMLAMAFQTSFLLADLISTGNATAGASIR